MERLVADRFTGAMNTLRLTVLLAATVTTGWMVGLYWSFSIAVMPGLARADDRTFVTGMQGINRAILNGWFALGFGGSLVLLALGVALHVPDDQHAALPGLIVALVLYVVTLVVTFGFNVPLNDAIDAAGRPDAVADLGAVRERFEQSWVRWNLVRTLASTGAVLALGQALVMYGRTTA